MPIEPTRSYNQDPLRGFKFRVTIDGFSDDIGFQSISGLGRTVETIDYREGGYPETMHKIPGLVTFDNIVLTRGKFAPVTGTSARDFLTWANQVWDPSGSQTANDFRRTVTIFLYGRTFEEGPKWQWKAINAWPSVFKVDDLSASDSNILIETLELAHECLIHEAIS